MQAVARRRRLVTTRRQQGHLHQFTAELALQALLEAGYEPVDHRYAAGSLERPCQSLPCKIARLPRRLAPRRDELFEAHLRAAGDALGDEVGALQRANRTFHLGLVKRTAWAAYRLAVYESLQRLALISEARR